VVFGSAGRDLSRWGAEPAFDGMEIEL